MNKKKILVLIIIAILIIFIDQFSKIIIVEKGEIKLLGEIVQIKTTKNTGAAFNFLNENILGVIATDIIVLFILLKFIIKNQKNINKLTNCSLIFIISGGISNLIDRVFKGGVIDFIDISNIIKNFPIFNIADVFIVIGFIMFVVLSWINLVKLNNLKKGVE